MKAGGVLSFLCNGCGLGCCVVVVAVVVVFVAPISFNIRPESATISAENLTLESSEHLARFFTTFSSSFTSECCSSTLGNVFLPSWQESHSGKQARENKSSTQLGSAFPLVFI